MGKKTTSYNNLALTNMSSSEYEEFQIFIIESEPQYK